MRRLALGSTPMRRLLVGVLSVTLASATCTTVLLVHSPTPEANKAGQHSVVPHLVPDVGRFPFRSQSSSSTPKVATANPGIKLIPSAGGPVRLYGGVPSGPTFLPAQKR